MRKYYVVRFSNGFGETSESVRALTEEQVAVYPCSENYPAGDGCRHNDWDIVSGPYDTDVEAWCAKS